MESFRVEEAGTQRLTNYGGSPRAGRDRPGAIGGPTRFLLLRRADASQSEGAIPRPVGPARWRLRNEYFHAGLLLGVEGASHHRTRRHLTDAEGHPELPVVGELFGRDVALEREMRR